MKILRRLFSKSPNRIADKSPKDKEWEENTKKEQELIKIRNRKMENLNKHEQMVAKEIFQDVDDAGNKTFEKNQNKSRAIGAGIGTTIGTVPLAAVLSNKARGKGGKLSPVQFAAPIVGFAGGALIGDAITMKKNRRIAEKIWEKGDKEQMEYITANKKKKADIVNSYIPIEYRIDKHGNYTKQKEGHKGQSLDERAKNREAQEKRMKDLKKKFIKSLKETGYENTKK